MKNKQSDNGSRSSLRGTWSRLSIRWKVLMPIAVIGVISSAVLYYVVTEQQIRQIERAGQEEAAELANQIVTVRAYYTRHVVGAVLGRSGISAHFDHMEKEGVIPFPATLTHDVSNILSADRHYDIRLYSPYPFPNRADEGGLHDEFQERAWTSLQERPDDAYSVIAEGADGPVVRYAIADLMSVEGCVACHNSHPDTPRTGWELGDVRGVLEVALPIGERVAAARGLGSAEGIGVLAVGVGGGALAFAIVALVILSVTRRVDQVRHKVNTLAAGDLSSEPLSVDMQDEVSEAAQSVNTMEAQLRELIQEVMASAKELTEAGAQITEFSASTRESAKEQRDETDQLATASNEMSSTAEEVARNASDARDASRQGKELTEEGGRQAQMTLDAIERLNSAITSTAERIRGLEEESDAIGTVIDVISEITEQTNLLALNAAIEAARAGDSGRGFAVVADEVRKLATRTQESTTEIREKIEGLQQGVKNSVESMTGATEQASQGRDLTVQTVDILKQIRERNGQIEDMFSLIASATEEQTSALEEMNGNVHRVNDGADRNDEQSRKVAEVSHRLSALTEQMQAKLKRFRL